MTVVAALAVIAATCSGSGALGPGELHRQWILEGWERLDGDGHFVFAEKLGRFYSRGNDLHLYDSFDPQHRVARTAAEYASYWEGPFNSFRSARHAVTDGPAVLIEAGLAATTLEFVARLESADGKVISNRARSAMVWRCEQGRWRIVREQNAVREVPHAEVEAALVAGIRSVEQRSHANRDIVKAAFEAWAAGGTHFFDDVLADDVRWTIRGSGPVARTYVGRAEFVREASAPLNARLAGPVKPEVRHLLADGDLVIAVWDGTAIARDAKQYKNNFVWILRMRDGKAVEVEAFLDLESYNEVLRRVPPR